MIGTIKKSRAHFFTHESPREMIPLIFLPTFATQACMAKIFRRAFVGVHQSVLCFEASFYPSVTNSHATVLIGTSPPVALDTLESNTFWNLELSYGSHKISVLGLLPSGTHIFTNGKYVTSPEPWMSSNTRLSGWEGGSRTSSPGQVQSWRRHRTAVPTVYLRAPELAGGVRLGVRIRDQQGRWWTTKVQPQGANLESAYLLEVPPDVKTVTAEIVLLKPVHAQFFVNTLGSKGD